MAKCYFTGVNISLEESFLLDFGPALKALKDLRQRAASIQRIVEQLSPSDDVEIYNAKKDKMETKRDRRLVSKAMAETLAVAYPEGRLFVSWQEWKSRFMIENNNTVKEVTAGDNCPAESMIEKSNHETEKEIQNAGSS